jgi:hypothetical protein
VILGFNVFGPRVAKVNRRAPEHSDAFNNTVRLYQASARLGKFKQQAAPIHSRKPTYTRLYPPIPIYTHLYTPIPT